MSLKADNAVVSTAIAQPQAAAFGASVAVSVVTATTNALIDGSATIGAGSLSLAATTSTAVTVTAAAAAGGATAPSSGSEASSYLSNAKYTPFESTGEGKLSVVGALAISDLTSTTTANSNAYLHSNDFHTYHDDRLIGPPPPGRCGSPRGLIHR